MWRRIPLLPILFGAFAGWALLTMLASRERALIDTNIYIAVGASSATFAVLVDLLLRLLGRPSSTAGSIGFGCLYATIGFFFAVPIALAAFLITGQGVRITGVGPALMTIAGFAGLGILAGILSVRFRRAEEERRQAALDRQQLELARDLQQRLLPPPLLDRASYRIVARNVPAAYVAGDFYDFIAPPSGGVLIVLADVAGKGVGAGMIMATVKAMIPMLAAEESEVAPLLGRLNDKLVEQLSRREFVALTLARYDPDSGTLTIANAGLPDPLVVSPAGEGKMITVRGPRYPVGIRRNVSYESITTRLVPGDRILFFSDGLPEAGLATEPLGYERFIAEAIRVRADLEPLFASLDAMRVSHDDDWTAVMLERLV